MTPVPVQPQPPIDAAPAQIAPDVTPKQKNYIPWLLGILVLVVISVTPFLILAGKSKSTPTESLVQPSVSPEQTTVADTDVDTSSWKTYINPSFGVAFQYPSNWTVIMDSKNTGVTIKADPTDRSSGIEISSLNRQNYVSLDHWLAQNDKECKEIKQLAEKTGGDSDCVVYSRLGERKINQFASSKVLWSCCGSGPTIRYFIEGPDKIYLIDLFQDWENFNLNTAGDYDEGSSKLAKVYQQILSTFEFIDTATNKINITLPVGWSKSVEKVVNPFDETEEYERTVLVKGNYKIEIGDPVGGGRANCDAGVPAPSILNNLSLSSKVKRTNYSKYSFDALTAQVCSNFVSEDYLDYGTKIGMIKYVLPINWDQTILKEMDSIVESITLVK